jgi:hypothetical protein
MELLTGHSWVKRYLRVFADLGQAGRVDANIDILYRCSEIVRGQGIGRQEVMEGPCPVHNRAV